MGLERRRDRLESLGVTAVLGRGGPCSGCPIRPWAAPHLNGLLKGKKLLPSLWRMEFVKYPCNVRLLGTSPQPAIAPALS